MVGWSWDAVPHRQRGATRHGIYRVVGHYDGERFTVSERPTAVEGTRSPQADVAVEPFRTPCPQPAGGWWPIDGSTTTPEAFDRAVALARADPGHCVYWVDQNLPPGAANPMDNDPARIILNVATTGDTATLKRTLRTLWGG